LDALIDEITVDAYNYHEQETGFLVARDGGAHPRRARAAGWAGADDLKLLAAYGELICRTPIRGSAGQMKICRPSRCRSAAFGRACGRVVRARSAGRVAESRVGLLAFGEHAPQDRHVAVDVVDDADVVLGITLRARARRAARRR
jgi:hypothetical protein